MITAAHHWFLFWAIRIHSTLSHTLSIWSIQILYSRLCLGLLCLLFSSAFPIEIV